MKTVLLRLLFLAALLTQVQAAPPLNIVVLLADDWRFDTLGVAGNSYVHTPNVDRLATQGVYFPNAAVTTAICGVSRATLITGQWMSRHGQRDFGMFKTPWADTLPARLRAAGYQVAHVGKWHNGKFPAENYDFSRVYSGEHWITKGKGPPVHVTQQNESDAMEFLKSRDAQKPFYLQVAFFAPHAQDNHPLQYLPQPQSFELFNDASVKVPVNAGPDSTARLPAFLSAEENEGRNRWRWRFDTPGKYQMMMKNYFRLVAEVDAVCGRILAELDRQGIADNTLVIFTADNGYLHGEHGLADKWYPFEECIRVPLIIRDPRHPAPGHVSKEWALNVDLAPTMIAAAGLPPADTMQGRDLVPLYDGATPADWRQEFFYEHPTIRSKTFIPTSEALVSHDWKYVVWPEYSREQLFQISTDPHEENDRIADPAAAAMLMQMRQRFTELKAKAK